MEIEEKQSQEEIRVEDDQRLAEKRETAESHVEDAPTVAEKLAELVREIAEPKELIIAMHEPYTGIHVGPGMLSLFFLGAGR